LDDGYGLFSLRRHAMNWRDVPAELDDEGNPKCVGHLVLVNDKNEELAGLVWFYDGGPFYASAVDLREPDVLRRIGPCTTLESGKEACMRVIQGDRDVSGHAGYPR
jgi:hypothetical protein